MDEENSIDQEFNKIQNLLLSTINSLEKQSKSTSLNNIYIKENLQSIKYHDKRLEKMNENILIKQEELKLLNELLNLKDENKLLFSDLSIPYLNFLVSANKNYDDKLNSLYQKELIINKKEKIINNILGINTNNLYDQIDDNIITSKPIDINKFLTKSKTNSEKIIDLNRNLEKTFIHDVNNSLNDNSSNKKINNSNLPKNKSEKRTGKKKKIKSEGGGMSRIPNGKSKNSFNNSSFIKMESEKDMLGSYKNLNDQDFNQILQNFDNQISGSKDVKNEKKDKIKNIKMDINKKDNSKNASSAKNKEKNQKDKKNGNKQQIEKKNEEKLQKEKENEDSRQIEKDKLVKFNNKNKDQNKSVDNKKYKDNKNDNVSTKKRKNDNTKTDNLKDNNTINKKNKNFVKNNNNKPLKPKKIYNLTPEKTIIHARKVLKKLLFKQNKYKEIFKDINYNPKNDNNLKNFILYILDIGYFWQIIIILLHKCSKIYNKNMKIKNSEIIINDSDFLDKLDTYFCDNRNGIDKNDIEMYENGLNKIKKLDNEISDLKNKISDFVKEINA